MRVLVVDDEIYTREGIVEYIDWQSLGVDEVMDADDGTAALHVADWFQPDIVISDVKMPQMDGITFAHRFLEKFPDSKIIFISAYLEIRYYREALKLSAVDYVEKPLDMDELTEAVQKAVRSIEENQKRQEGVERGKLVLEEQTVNYLINPRKKEARCQELCLQTGFPLTGWYISLCFKDLEKEDDRQTVITMIDDFFRERRLFSLTARNEGYSYCCILAMNEITKDHHSIKELGFQFTNRYPSFQIGLGFHVDHLSGIPESWKLARNVLNRAFYEPQKTVFEKEELQEPVRTVDSGIYSRVSRVMADEPERFPVVINAVFGEFEGAKSLNPASVKAFAKAITADLLRQRRDAEELREKVFLGQTPEEYIDNCESLEEIHQLIMAVANSVMGKEEFSGISPVVKSACRYIRNHYDSPELGLAEIAEECGISTGYLSMVFKKEMKVTARQFIEEYRIEAAKERLAHTNERVQDISEA